MEEGRHGVSENQDTVNSITFYRESQQTHNHETRGVQEGESRQLTSVLSSHHLGRFYCHKKIYYMS